MPTYFQRRDFLVAGAGATLALTMDRANAQEAAPWPPPLTGATNGTVSLRSDGFLQVPDAVAKARELLDLAARNRNDALYGDAVFEANMILGKIALRRGDKKAAARNLLIAAGTPGSERLRRGQFEMNLPRALVDWGERHVVAEFFERMAPKTVRSKQFQDWAADIRKGINPDLSPTFSAPGCSQDPC